MPKRILTLIHPTGHPYWQKNEFTVIHPNGEIVPISKLFWQGNHGGYEISVEKDGIYFHQCCSSSGSGKYRTTSRPPTKIVDRSEYDEIKYEGEPLVMSDNLKSEVATIFQ